MSNASMDVKKPDPIMVVLQQAFDWVISKAVWIAGAVVVLVLIGGGWAIWHQISESKEMDWQAKYSSIEKRYLDQKRGFQEAAQKEQLRKADPKAPAAAGPVGTLPSGDLSKDYGAIVTDFEALIQEAPKTRAAEMAALNLAVLQAEHKQEPAALATIQKVNASNRTDDLIGALVVNMKATLQANQGQCPEAVNLFEKITKDSKATFLHKESKLRMGLCYEKMNDFAKAQAAYQEASQKPEAADGAPPANSDVTQDAERYLRLLKMKQSEQRGS